MDKASSNMPSRHTIARILFLAAIVWTPLGCGQSGPAYWPISGKVTFQGKPVGNGQIRFCNSKAGIDVVESLDAEGRYTVVTGKRKGVPGGQYQVAVMPKLDFSNVKCNKDGRPLPSTMPSVSERNPPNIPAKYHDPATSGLTMTVKPESNTFDVDMQPTK
jgi:hypothetical protein